MYFFFQAEDGIRDYKVTGVQTCALPIFAVLQWCRAGRGAGGDEVARLERHDATQERHQVRNRKVHIGSPCSLRSEERRVGKERIPQWYQHSKKLVNVS